MRNSSLVEQFECIAIGLAVFLSLSVFAPASAEAESSQVEATAVAYKRYLRGMKINWPADITPSIVTTIEIQDADLSFHFGLISGSNCLFGVSHKPMNLEILSGTFNPELLYTGSNLLQVVGFGPEKLWCATFGRNTYVERLDRPFLPCDFETSLHSSAFECVAGVVQVTEVARLGVLYAMPGSMEFDLGAGTWKATDRLCNPIQGTVLANNAELKLNYSVLGENYTVIVHADPSKIAEASKGIFRNEELFRSLLPDSIKVFKKPSPKPFCVYERDQSESVQIPSDYFSAVASNVSRQMRFREWVTNNSVIYVDPAGKAQFVRTDTADDPRVQMASKNKKRLAVLVAFFALSLLAGSPFLIRWLKRRKEASSNC